MDGPYLQKEISIYENAYQNIYLGLNMQYETMKFNQPKTMIDEIRRKTQNLNQIILVSILLLFYDVMFA